MSIGSGVFDLWGCKNRGFPLTRRVALTTTVLHYRADCDISAKNWQNWMTSHEVITKIKRVTIFLRHSVLSCMSKLHSVIFAMTLQNLYSSDMIRFGATLQGITYHLCVITSFVKLKTRNQYKYQQSVQRVSVPCAHDRRATRYFIARRRTS